MKNMTKGRSLFTTRCGFVGLGPRSTLRKDTDWGKDCLYEVHVIKGAKVPYVFEVPKRNITAYWGGIRLWDYGQGDCEDCVGA